MADGQADEPANNRNRLHLRQKLSHRICICIDDDRYRSGMVWVAVLSAVGTGRVMATRPLVKWQRPGYRCEQVLKMVRVWMDTRGHAPSYSEIRDELGFLTNADVCKVVERLERRAVLSRVGRGRVRRIRLH